MSEVLGYVYEKKKLWARTNSDDDFLDIRIGSGNIPLKAKLNAPREHFDMEEDVLKDELAELTDDTGDAGKCAYHDPASRKYRAGRPGKLRKTLLVLSTPLVLQLAILFSYDEVKLVFLDGGKASWTDMGYIKYLSARLG